jgi:hypothetical protein
MIQLSVNEVVAAILNPFRQPQLDFLQLTLYVQNG